MGQPAGFAQAVTLFGYKADGTLVKVLVGDNGALVSGGSGSAGDTPATTAFYETTITRLTAIQESVAAPVGDPIFARLSDGVAPIDLIALLGAINEPAPASDTAPAGHGGRLQRLAQRITSLIDLFPVSRGQKTKAGSLAVVFASDSDALALAASNNNIGDVDIATVTASVVASMTGSPVELLNANTGGANNNRTFTVPAGKVWQVESFRITYTSSATANNRGVRITYETSGGSIIYGTRAGALQAASLTREYSFAAGNPYDTAFGGVNGDYLMVSLGPLLLKAGQIIRIRDAANVSNADSFTVNGLAHEWTVA